MPVESLKYSIPYLILVMFFILLFVLENTIKKQKIRQETNMHVIAIASIGGLLLFFGFRGFIGWDWYVYFPLFRDIPPFFDFNSGLYSRGTTDYGFVTYMSIIKWLWNDFHFFILLNTILDIIILYIFIKRYSRYSLSLACLIFIVMGGFYLETDLLRSAKAMMLFLLSLKYIEEKKPVQFLVLNFVGALFHISAVLYMPLYLIMNIKISRNKLIIFFSIGLILFLSQIEYIRPFLSWISGILGEKFTLLLDKYLKISAYSSAYGITIGLLERILTSALILIYYDKLLAKDSRNRLFINSYLIYFILFFYFAEIKIIPVRVGGMFSFAYWIIFPALLEVIEKKNNRAIFISGFFAYSIIKIAGMTDNILYRYVNVLFGSDDYSSRVKIFESSLDVLFR